MVETKTTRAGKVGVTPKGAWSATYNNSQGYDLLDEVLYGHDSWISTAEKNRDEPTAASAKWFRSTNGGQYAYEQGQNASEKAALANEKAVFANTQGNRAKGYNDHPWEIRGDGYIWVWDETAGQMKRANRMIVGWEDLTTAQQQAIISAIAENIVFATVTECRTAMEELT